MPKLTDTQLVILSAAAGRKDGAVLPLPKSLKVKGGAVTKTLKALCKKGLVTERPPDANEAHWHEAEDGRRMTLAITEAGLQAVGAESDADTGQTTAAPKCHPKTRATTGKSKTPKRDKSTKRKRTASKAGVQGLPPTVRAGTKQALLIDLLKRKQGATIEEIAEATGWQAHSVRGAISGTLKKKLGLAVVSEKVEGRGRVYRIAEGRKAV